MTVFPKSTGQTIRRAGVGSDSEPGPAEAQIQADTALKELESLRERISGVDDQLIRVIGERKDLVLEVGRIKELLGLPVMDPAQEARVVRKAAVRARELGVDEEMTRDVIWRIIASARASQTQRPAGWPDRPTPSADEVPEP